MKAARIHHFGPPDVIVLDDVPRPTPDPDQVLISVIAAGVGPWDAHIREQKSVVNIQLDDLKRDTTRWQERNNPGRIQLRPQSSDGPS